jgi:hypothetical protein
MNVESQKVVLWETLIGQNTDSTRQEDMDECGITEGWSTRNSDWSEYRQHWRREDMDECGTTKGWSMRNSDWSEYSLRHHTTRGHGWMWNHKRLIYEKLWLVRIQPETPQDKRTWMNVEPQKVDLWETLIDQNTAWDTTRQEDMDECGITEGWSMRNSDWSEYSLRHHTTRGNEWMWNHKRLIYEKLWLVRIQPETAKRTLGVESQKVDLWVTLTGQNTAWDSTRQEDIGGGITEGWSMGNFDWSEYMQTSFSPQYNIINKRQALIPSDSCFLDTQCRCFPVRCESEWTRLVHW